MIDLNKIVNETLVNLEEEKFVEKVVKARLEKTITGIVDDVFREYGDFGKSLKAHIENNLNVNLDRLGIEGYNTLALAAIKEQLDKTITVQGIERLKKSTEEMLSDVKKSYNLSELIETLKNKFCFVILTIRRRWLLQDLRRLEQQVIDQKGKQ